MGQGQGRHALPGQMGLLSDRLWQNAAEIKQLTSLSYEQFVTSITILNELADNFSDVSGKKLVFLIKKGTDESMFWHATIRIKCSKVNARSGNIELTKLLTLKQYLRIYNEMMRHAASITSSSVDGPEGGDGSASNTSNCMDASVLMMQIDAVYQDADAKDVDECIICMDRKATIILPCAHAYCEQCIDAWQGSHKTCPVCRATVSNSKESWVLSEKPDEQEMAHEASGYVMGLIDSHPTDPDSSDTD